MRRAFIFIFAMILSGCMNQPLHRADVLILNIGSPATPKIAKRLELLGVSYIIHPGFLSKEDIQKVAPRAIIITGSPKSIFDVDAPYASKDFYDVGVPVLGLCYGMQMIADQLGGKVKKCQKSEKGMFPVKFTGQCGITPPSMKELQVLMDHDDCVTELPEDFITDASSEITTHAMSCSPQRQMYLIQFHPERYDSAPESGIILDLFIKKVMASKA